MKDGNILRGWDGYLGKQASSGAIRRINRFREADRMFSASSVSAGEKSSSFASSTKVAQRHAAPAPHTRAHCVPTTPHPGLSLSCPAGSGEQQHVERQDQEGQPEDVIVE